MTISKKRATRPREARNQSPKGQPILAHTSKQYILIIALYIFAIVAALVADAYRQGVI